MYKKQLSCFTLSHLQVGANPETSQAAQSCRVGPLEEAQTNVGGGGFSRNHRSTFCTMEPEQDSCNPIWKLTYS